MHSDPADLPIQYVKGVGPRRAQLLARLGIHTVRDVLYHFPHRYEDRSSITKISQSICGNVETVLGKVISLEVINRRNLRLFELILNDGSGLIKGKWFNQSFLKKNFKLGQEVLLHGTVKNNPYWASGFEMENPEYEVLLETGDAFVHLNRIVPVHKTTSGLSVRQMRSILFTVINSLSNDIVDPLPEPLKRKYGLPGLAESIRQIHFPENVADMGPLNTGASIYHRRVAFEELFLLELGIAVMKKENARGKGIAFSPQGHLLTRLVESLPFSLTEAQKKVFADILNDMKSASPMQRLIQGDVGCGKTVIALMAMIVAAECGYQTALMAPTEILAEQHFMTVRDMAQRLGVTICLLTSARKEKPLEKIASGEITAVVGTHALIQENVAFRNLGLAVIDEQHRFGVVQRALLRKKAKNPDVLVMTATPIPRTLSLTLYGDLDCSVIDHLPPGRKPVSTLLCHPDMKERLYNLIREEVGKGRQVYVVYPLIEESEKTDLKSAELGKKALEKIFPGFEIGLLHGRMKAAEREEVMDSFKCRKIMVLVSTTVIEVGVDVPNATLMIIIHAERFGLSQLHQLRGRIGRGVHHSQCVLLAYPPYGEEARRRLGIMVESNDGFRIAEEDLAIRGPGEFFGTRQSGIPELKVADILRDSMLLHETRTEAFDIVGTDPELKNFPILRRSLEKFWEGRIELFKTG